MRAGTSFALLLYAPLAISAAIGASPVSLEELKSSALGGDAEAAYRLGRAYKVGVDVPVDTRQAERWFAKAVGLGHAKSGAEYGLVLLQNGKPRDALPWLSKAAAAGDARAQYGLGTLLFSGGAGEKNEVEARQWMTRAARAGLPAAVEALAIMRDPSALEAQRAGITVVTIGAQPVARPPTPALPTSASSKKVSQNWSVQLGAFSKPENARRYWSQVKEGSPGKAAFPVIGGLTRVRVGPFDNPHEAERYCRGHLKHGRDCLKLRSGSSS
jgi:hypothetical protein